LRNAPYVGNLTTFNLADEIRKGHDCIRTGPHSLPPAKAQFTKVLIDFLFRSSARVKGISYSGLFKQRSGLFADTDPFFVGHTVPPLVKDQPAVRKNG
jgi:hypothetical protein